MNLSRERSRSSVSRRCLRSGECFGLEAEFQAARVDHAAQDGEQREPDEHQQCHAEQEREVPAIHHDGTPEPPAADCHRHDEEEGRSQSAGRGGNGPGVECLAPRAGDGVGGDDGGKRGEREKSQRGHEPGTEGLREGTGCEVEDCYSQAIRQRAHLAERVGRLRCQDGRVGPALRGVIQQHEGVLEEPGTDDQEHGDAE